MEIQSKFGPDNQLDKCISINIGDMNNGQCVLTYNWGNSFMDHLKGDSLFKAGEGKFGVAMTPGSTHVLDRETPPFSNAAASENNRAKARSATKLRYSILAVAL